MTGNEIARHSEELRQIVELLKPEMLKDIAKEDETRRRLKMLTLEVGAWPYTVKNGSRAEASNHELVANIQQALQTASMIDACRTAAKNHEITLKAQESARQSQWVSVAAAFAAIATAIAAWVWH